MAATPWRSAFQLGGILALVRVSALWHLAYREWTRAQSLSTLPLVLLLHPEGLAFSQSEGWSPARLLLFSAALVVGSLAAVLAMAKGVAIVKGIRTQPKRPQSRQAPLE